MSVSLLASSRLPQLSVTVVGVAAVLWPWQHRFAAMSPLVMGTTALAIVAAMIGVWLRPDGHLQGHLALAAAVLVLKAAFIGSRILGAWPFEWDALGDPRYASLLLGILGLTMVGLLAGKIWGRWMAMAFAGTSVVGGTLNFIGQTSSPNQAMWLAGVSAFSGATLWCQLSLPLVREHFEHHAQHALWRSRRPLARAARWAAIASFAAAPMLVLYGLAQPVAPLTVSSAFVLAPLSALGAVLVLLRRAVGVVLLALTGVALVAQCAVTLLTAPVTELQIAAYYCAFWGPAAALGLLSGALFWHRRRSPREVRVS